MPKKNIGKASSSSTAAGVDLHEVERILDFMRKHGLEEFEYEGNGVRVVLKKTSDRPRPGQAGHSGSASAAKAEPAAAPPPATHVVAEVNPAESSGKGQSQAEDVHVVKSPIVGTFYTAASPDAEPFVTVGAQVPVGKVLCIIEAMKLMNEIESDVAGEVVRIFVENGHPVEYGEPLFGIRPNRKK